MLSRRGFRGLAALALLTLSARGQPPGLQRSAYGDDRLLDLHPQAWRKSSG